jgi:very-short-patch-repair endonuclease
MINKKMHYGASNIIFQRAEELRKNSTKEEEIVWGFLCGNKLGVKFRRQHPFSNYIADFYCHSLKLAIEIDGGIHLRSDIKSNDTIRQKEIESFGIKIIRFTNKDVLQEPLSVLKMINDTIKELQSKSSVTPSGAGGLKAMIFSAGLGTRFKPWTDSHPKALALINGKSLLQRNIEYLQQYDIREVVINVHHFAGQVIAAVKENEGWGSNN